MKRNDHVMIAMARQAADPVFGHHLLLLRDSGYLDGDFQITDAGRAFVAGADAANEKAPHEAGLMAAVIDALMKADKKAVIVPPCKDGWEGYDLDRYGCITPSDRRS